MNRLKFHGSGGDLFGLFLKNIVLTILSGGIYSFWAKTNVQKYMAENLEWEQERFSFHGSGEERIIGFLKAAALVFVTWLAYLVVAYFLDLVPITYFAAIVKSLIGLILILGIIPFILIGNRRYLTSRTGYRNLRFGFDGKAIPLMKIYLKGIFLTSITLGFYYPWFFAEKEAFLRSRTRYGNVHFGFEAEGKELFFIYLKGIVLSIITLGIYSSWLIAEIQNYIWNQTTFQGKKIQSDITGGMILGNIILSYLIIIFTLGIGFAWAVVRMTRMFTETLSLESEIDFSIITAKVDTDASATTEGIDSIANALESFLG